MSEHHEILHVHSKKRKIQLLKRTNLILLLFILLFFGIFLFQRFTLLKTTDVELKDQHWNNAPGIILVKKETQEKPGVEIYRLQDGAPEKVDGNWNFSFVANNRLFLFGSLLGEEDIQRLFIVTDRGSSKRDISKLPGPILSISENPRSTYLLISGLSQDNSSTTYYSCVTEKQSPNLQPCDSVLGKILPDYDKSTYYQSFWNQKHERELIIQELGGEKRLFAYDPWEETPTLVTNTYDHKIQKELEDVVDPRYFKRFANVIFFRNMSNEKWKIFTVPKGSDTRWADRDHLLVITPSQGTYMLDVQNGKKSHFIDVNNTPEIKFSTFYSTEK